LISCPFCAFLNTRLQGLSNAALTVLQIEKRNCAMMLCCDSPFSGTKVPKAITRFVRRIMRLVTFYS